MDDTFENSKEFQALSNFGKVIDSEIIRKIYSRTRISLHPRGWSRRGFRLRFYKDSKIDDSIIKENIENYNGLTIGTFVWVRDKDINTIFHETYHLMDNIIEIFGIGFEEREFKAYIFGYLSSKVIDYVNSISID